MKRFIIVKHGAKEIANCLINDMSIFAYALETGASVINATYFEKTPLLRFFHTFYSRFVDIATRKTCGIWTTGTPKFLPPTAPMFKKFDECETLYFFGWLFRNPIGLERYREALIAKFAPNEHVQRKINGIMTPLQSKRMRIGIHIRQKPFKGFGNGEFLIPRSRVQEIVNEYLLEHHMKKGDVAFIEVSDLWKQKDDLIGLYLLSRCDVVIGDNSTFSSLAAWFGNVPHVVTTNEPIDWPYYRGKINYFDNKYETFTHGSLLYS
ncbi:hypothetical protein HY412_01500 [Candidatus Kaiserbacteria bacterium]|nr:hypothetical protein [Candidatus Kaiserbacteria bacterium]